MPQFHSQRKLARWLLALLAFNLLTSLGMLVSFFIQFRLLQSSPDSISSMAMRELYSNPWIVFPPNFQMLAGFTTAIVALLWIYNAHQNLAAFRTQGLRYSSAEAIAYWFIPIMNLFRPYQVMKEMCLASDPERDSSVPDSWRSGRRPASFPWWWFFFLLSFASIHLRVSGMAIPRSWLLASCAAGSIASLGNILAGVFFILIVKEIDRRQEAKSQVLPAPSVEPAPQPTPQAAPAPTQTATLPKKKKGRWLLGCLLTFFLALISVFIVVNYWINTVFSEKHAKMERALRENLADSLTYTEDHKIILKEEFIGCLKFSTSWNLGDFMRKKDQASIDRLIQKKACSRLEKGSRYDFLNLIGDRGDLTLVLSSAEEDYYVFIPQEKITGTLPIEEQKMEATSPPPQK